MARRVGGLSCVGKDNLAISNFLCKHKLEFVSLFFTIYNKFEGEADKKIPAGAGGSTGEDDAGARWHMRRFSFRNVPKRYRINNLRMRRENNKVDYKMIKGLVIHENGIFIETNNQPDDFWVFLGDLIGWGKFSPRTKRLATPNRGCFELVEVRPCPPSLSQDQSILKRCVLWSRPAALSASQCIHSYLEDLERIPE